MVLGRSVDEGACEGIDEVAREGSRKGARVRLWPQPEDAGSGAGEGGGA